MKKRGLLVQLGLVEYGEAFRFQRAVAAARELEELPDTLILLEHPPVLTLGRRANRDNILFSEEWLASQGVSLYQSSRGGDVTYHGPGQIVGYPIFALRALGMGVAQYVHKLEQAIIVCLGRFGVMARQDPEYIGVWVGDEKVAAIGVAVSRGITLHGFALNVDPNLGHFRLINPCGITQRGVTSMARLLGRPVSTSEVLPSLLESFAQTFELDLAADSRNMLRERGVSLPRSAE